MITLSDIFEVSATLEDGSLDVHLRAILGFRAWHMVVEHEAELGSGPIDLGREPSCSFKFLELLPTIMVHIHLGRLK